jgi:proline utilization trans-activator
VACHGRFIGLNLTLVSYLRRLEAENKELKRKRSSEYVPYVSPSATSLESHDTCLPPSNGSTGGTTNSEPRVEEDFSFENDETFIEPNYIGEAACTTFGSRLHQYLTADDSQWPPRRPHYYRNQRLHRLVGPDYQLPNRNYAQLLVMVVLRFM